RGFRVHSTACRWRASTTQHRSRVAACRLLHAEIRLLPGLSGFRAGGGGTTQRPEPKAVRIENPLLLLGCLARRGACAAQLLDVLLVLERPVRRSQSQPPRPARLPAQPGAHPVSAPGPTRRPRPTVLDRITGHFP